MVTSQAALTLFGLDNAPSPVAWGWADVRIVVDASRCHCVAVRVGDDDGIETVTQNSDNEEARRSDGLLVHEPYITSHHNEHEPIHCGACGVQTSACTSGSRRSHITQLT